MIPGGRKTLTTPPDDEGLWEVAREIGRRTAESVERERIRLLLNLVDEQGRTN